MATILAARPREGRENPALPCGMVVKREAIHPACKKKKKHSDYRNQKSFEFAGLERQLRKTLG